MLVLTYRNDMMQPYVFLITIDSIRRQLRTRINLLIIIQDNNGRIEDIGNELIRSERPRIVIICNKKDENT
jgi:hypothetical protein